MGKAIYTGVSGVARNVKQPSIGVSNVARNVSNGYIGVNGVARQFYQKELVIFNYGVADSNLEIEENNAEYGSDCIDFDNGIVFTYNGTVDMSEYTMFCMYTKVSWLEEDYVRFSLEKNSNEIFGTDYAHFSEIEEIYYTVQIPLSTTYSGGFYMRIRNTSNSTGGTIGNLNGKIYKIWFE